MLSIHIGHDSGLPSGDSKEASLAPLQEQNIEFYLNCTISMKRLTNLLDYVFNPNRDTSPDSCLFHAKILWNLYVFLNS